MPYNTRRKSLSLPSLGIHLPNASRSHRSPSASKAPSTVDVQPPPSKKVKRSHSSGSPSPGPDLTEVQTPKVSPSFPKGRRGNGLLEHTPPPSPADVNAGGTKIDTEGISDDIVVAVIEQLEETGNRPHLIKELATVLSKTNETVANSANAAALLSSRLSLYLKRPWTALAPCPIAKELIPVHPRKVFFYLTTCPHQPLPEDSGDIIAPTTEPKQITPSLSSASVDLEDADDVLARERARLSPSPEVDLSPEFDEESDEDLMDHSAPTGSFCSRNSLVNAHNHRLSHTNRSASPPLEGDEREFTQTATSVRERTSSEELASRLRHDLENGEKERTGSPDSAVSGVDDSAQGNGEAVGHDQSQSHDNNDEGYFDLNSHVQNHDLDTAAVTALFGTSPSPSASSELSSLSSGASATSDAEPEVAMRASGQLAVDPLNGNSDATTTIGPGISSSRLDSGFLGSKRPFSMFEAASVEDESPCDLGTEAVRIMDSDMEASLAIEATTDAPIVGKSYTDLDDVTILAKPAMQLSMSLSAGLESWNDLRSPETVEVDELDDLFADI